MNIPMFVYILLFGNFIKFVITYNKLLTYTVRFNKIIIHPNITGNYTIDQYKGIQYVNGHVHINTKESLNNVIAIFYRCNQEGINCEYFQTWTITDICHKLKEKNQIWSIWYEKFDPPIHCPIQKYYQVKNATIDINTLFRLYPEVNNYQWKVTQKIYNDNKFIGSYTIFISIFGYRKH